MRWFVTIPPVMWGCWLLAKIALSTGEVHIWQNHFSAHHADDLLPQLSEDENHRATRLIDPKRRAQFIIARRWLRGILGGHYLDQSPGEIVFSYGERGKPFIANSDLHFNLSHSHDVMVLACTHIAPIGVDVEHVRPMTEMITVARDNFSKAEFARWQSLPPNVRQRAFYAIWTRKEAYIKATGDGFRLPLASFDVTHDDLAQILRITEDDPAQWALRALTFDDDYIGAICVRGRIMNVTFQE